MGIVASREIYRFGPFRLDPAERQLTKAGAIVPLQPRVLDTLLYLVERSGRLLTKDEIPEEVWKSAHVTENVLSRCIKEARQALDDDAREPTYIRTVPRGGYRFEAAIVKAEAETSPSGRIRSIAVLPFKPLIATARDESLELGMADTLIARLSNVRETTIRPLSAVRRYMELDSDPLEAGREQNVDAVLEGSIQHAAHTLRVTVRLLRTSDGSSIWAGRFDEEMNDIFALQDSIAERVLEELAVRISAPERERVGRRHTASPDAYQAYLLGRLHRSRQTEAGAMEAIGYFHRALEHDPSYPLPHVGIAEAYISLGTRGVRAREHYPRAREAALRALEIDPELAEALSALGSIAWQFDWDHDQARELFDRSISLNPNLAESRIAYADFCTFAGDIDDALIQGKRALDLDPVSPNINSLLAQAYYFGRRWDEGIAQLERAREIDPTFAFAEFFLACIELDMGELELAIKRLERVRTLTDRLDFVGVLGVAYGRAGKLDEVKALIREIKAVEQDLVPSILWALLQLGIGDKSAMYRWLRRMISERSWHIHVLFSDPMMADVREEFEAREILRESGLR